MSARCAVIFVFNGIGDHWLAHPAYRSLTRSFERVVWIGPRKHVTVIAADLRDSMECRALPDGLTRGGLLTDDEIEQICADVRCDAFVSFATYESRTARQLIERLAPGSVVSYFDAHPSAVLEPPERTHMADTLFHLAKAATGYRSVIDDYVSPLESFEAVFHDRAEGIFSEVSPEKKILVVHTESSEARKNLHRRDALEVLRTFLTQHADFVAFVLDLRELDPERHLDDLPVFSLSGFSLGTTAAVVAGSDLMLAVDSCFRHQGDSLGIPVVATYAATEPNQWGRRFGQGVDLVFESMQHAEATEIANRLCWAAHLCAAPRRKSMLSLK